MTSTSSTQSFDAQRRRRRGRISECAPSRRWRKRTIGSEHPHPVAMRLCRRFGGARDLAGADKSRGPNAVRDPAVLRVLRSDWTPTVHTALDLAMMQKVLPKVHGRDGESSRFSTALDALARGRSGPRLLSRTTRSSA